MIGNLPYDSPYKKKLLICDLYQEILFREATVQISKLQLFFLNFTIEPHRNFSAEPDVTYSWHLRIGELELL
jgi:hypothetical protein